MKKILLFTAFAACCFSSFAQSEKYMNAMKANITAMDTAFKNPANLLSLANSFERIANAEKQQWLPYYYAALLQVNHGFMSGDMSGMDPVADKAEVLLNKADSLSPANSEISVVKAMIATARMVVNPMQRYMEFGPVIDAQLEKAKQLDPTNPRPYYYKAENLKNTPEQFGGGCATALPELQKAKERFDLFKPASELHPNWGLSRTEMLIKECK
ncbi:MAG: hypothetical protein WAT19_07115 [Ferruginibacter sp.]